MTPEQRYFFDTSGFLHLKNVLTGEALQKAQEAADRYVKTPPEDLPPGFKKGNGGASHGFAFDKVLEALVFHPVTWPIVKELTAKKPRLASGSFRFESVESTRFFELHSGREEWGPQTPRYFMHDGRLYCDYFVCFFYLTDVFPGDGGLVLVPGSHKAHFERPEDFFASESPDADPEPHPAVLNITPCAGDVVVMSELMTHGALHWKPTDRDRRFLLMRYVPQFMGVTDNNLAFPFPEEILARVSPETRELIEFAPRNRVKEIVKRDVVTLS